MSIYVDGLRDHGWHLRGHAQRSCHLLADSEAELHAFAARLGMKRAWAQKSRRGVAHYDLTAKRRVLALKLGAAQASREKLKQLLKVPTT